MPKKVLKDIGKFTAGSLVLGAGSVAVYKAGGDASGMAAMGSMMPALGTLTMAKHSIRLSSKLMPKKKKKRY